MDDQPKATRRALLKSAGVVAGTAALGGGVYAATQDSQTTPPAPQWRRDYELSANHQAYSVTAFEQGYAFAGSISPNVNQENGFIAEVNREGDKEWSRSYDQTPREQAQSVTRTADGNYIFAGMTGRAPHEGDGYSGWVVKTDGAGNKIWEDIREYESIFYSVTELPSGDYVAAGYRDYDEQAGIIPIANVVKFAPDGTQNATAEYPSSREGPDPKSAFHATTTTDDGGLVLAGYYNPADERASGRVLKVDSSFELEWEYRRKTPSDFEDVTPLADGGYAATGATESEELVLVQVTESGQEDAFITYDELEGGVAGEGVELLANGDLALIGDYDVPKGEPGPEGNERGTQLLRTTPAGEVLWRTRHRDLDPVNVASTGDGGFVTALQIGISETTLLRYADPEASTATATPTSSDTETATRTDSPTDTATDTETADETATDTPTETQSETGTETSTETAAEDSAAHEDDCRI